MVSRDSYLLVDDIDTATKIAFIEDGRLAEFWQKEQGHELGEVHLARVVHTHAAQRRTTGQLQDGTKISWQNPPSARSEIGQLAEVTLTAFGWQDKPMQASLGAQLAGQYSLLVLGTGAKDSPIRTSRKQAENKEAAALLKALQGTELVKILTAAKSSLILRRRILTEPETSLPEKQDRLIKEAQSLLDIWQQHAKPVLDIRAEASPRQIFSGLPLLDQARRYAGIEETRLATGDNFDDLKEAVHGAASLPYQMANGARLWIEPTHAGVMVDMDSGASALPPEELASHSLPEIFYLLRLCSLAGRVLIDIPHLKKQPRQQIEALIHALCQADPRQPEFLALRPAVWQNCVIDMHVHPLTRPLEICDFRLDRQIKKDRRQLQTKMRNHYGR